MESRVKMEHWIRTILLLSIVIMGGFIIYAIIANLSKPYVDFGILNEDGEMGNYPTNVTVNEPISLMYFVDNQNPAIENFSVQTYLANYTTSTVTFAQGVQGGTALGTYNFTVNNGENYTSVPLTYTISSPGMNYRICFELWVLNQTTWNYLENSVQFIWINCTTS
jgi:uncharacterized membrane protein